MKDKIRVYDFSDIERNVQAYVDYMLVRTQAMFKWHNLPETIDERTLERRLQENGYVVFLQLNEDEILPFEEVTQPGGIYAMSGEFGGVLDFNGNPQYCLVVHPLLKDTKKVFINKECVLARNDSKFMGVLPLYLRYARAIAENDLSLFRADQQTRATAIMTANDNKGIESARRYIESLKKGDLAYCMQESKASPSIKTQPYFTEAGNQITNLIELEQFLKGSWFNEIGINANFNMKRETILESESDLNSDAIQPLVDQMLHERERACEALNAMFGLNVSVELHSAWQQEQVAHEQGGEDMSKEEELKNLGYLTSEEAPEVSEEIEESPAEIVEEVTEPAEEIAEPVEELEESELVEESTIESEPEEEQTAETIVNIEIEMSPEEAEPVEEMEEVTEEVTEEDEKEDE